MKNCGDVRVFSSGNATMLWSHGKRRPLGFGVRQTLGCDFLLLPTMGQTMSWSSAIAVVQQGYHLNI